MANLSIPGSLRKNTSSKMSWSQNALPRYSWIGLPVVLAGVSLFFGWKTTPLFKSCLSPRKLDLASKMKRVLGIPPLPNMVSCAMEEKPNKEQEDYQISGVYTTEQLMMLGLTCCLQLGYHFGLQMVKTDEFTIWWVSPLWNQLLSTLILKQNLIRKGNWQVKSSFVPCLFKNLNQT